MKKYQTVKACYAATLCNHIADLIREGKRVVLFDRENESADNMGALRLNTVIKILDNAYGYEDNDRYEIYYAYEESEEQEVTENDE